MFRSRHSAIGPSGRPRLHAALGAIAVALTLQPSNAATLAAHDREFLTAQAESQGGLFSVMLTLESLSLEKIKAQGVDVIRAATDRRAAELRAQLGSEVLETSYWNNSMGQVGLLVTAAGLSLLEHSPLIESIQPDQTRIQRDRAWLEEEDRSGIEAALRMKGVAEVELVLASDHEYELQAAARGAYRASPKHAEELSHALAELLASPAGKGLLVRDDAMVRAGLSPVVRARIDRVAWHGLRIAPQVRALRLVDVKRTAQWPQDVLDDAAKQGHAQVIISLRGAESFSPFEGYMSRSAWNKQGEAHKAAFAELLRAIGAGQGAAPVFYSGLGVMSVQLSASSLQALYASKDARVRSVELNKPVAQPLLHSSAPLVNMPTAWAGGIRGAGQRVAIFDTGARRSHAFFRNAAGNSRIDIEGCFGTTGIAGGIVYKTICPYPDVYGDSPFGFTGSSQPYQNSAYCALSGAYWFHCAHGTHVTGIAAGRSHTSITPSGIQGIAPDASIMSLQVFSFRLDDAGPPSAFETDILAALQAVISNTSPTPPNATTVNMSLGSGVIGFGCVGLYPSIALAISNLHSRGVPVVAGAGNFGDTNGLSWPACTPYTTKVSAVLNDGVGTTLASYSNIGNPSAFVGAILLAPGGQWTGSPAIRSSIGLSDTSMNAVPGTSMATPHVTGLFAAAKSVAPTATVPDIEAWALSDGGSIPVTLSLPWGTHTYRRIRVAL